MISLNYTRLWTKFQNLPRLEINFMVVCKQFKHVKFGVDNELPGAQQDDLLTHTFKTSSLEKSSLN